MNKAVIKVVGTHALIIGGFAAAATVVADLVKLYGGPNEQVHNRGNSR